MSRSGYSDDCDDVLAAGRWRAQVLSATRGKRGQEFFKDLLEALDAMPVKKLIAHELVTSEGEFCTLGVLGAKRGIPVEDLDPEDSETVARNFNIAEQLAREIVYMNDEYFGGTPEERWKQMRAWVQKQIKSELTTKGEQS